MRGVTIALAVLVLAAGCTGVQQDADPGVPGDTGAAGEALEPATETLYLDESMRLTPGEPDREEPGRVAMGSFYANWTAGEEQPTWRGAPMGGALLVDHAQLTLFYTANDSAVPTTGPAGQGFPEFVVYLGTDKAPQAWASFEGPDVVREDEVVRVTGELNLPTGGLVLPGDEAPIVKVAPVQGQGDRSGQVDLLVNGTETPSRIVVQGEPVALPSTREKPTLNVTGTLSGSTYVTGPEGPTAENHTVYVPPGAAGLTARLERVQGAGVADIDLDAFSPSGELVARSVTPEPREGVALFEPNLDATGTGAWTLRVVNVGNAAVEYRLTASVLEPVEGA